MKRGTLCLAVAIFGFGCGPTSEVLQDFDGDGSQDSSDCDPGDAAIYPGAPDSYGDNIDQNCDGFDGLDADGDGYPANEDLSEPALYDCDDNNPNVNPGATESPGNGIDENCDGSDEADMDADGTSDEQDCDPNDPLLNQEDRDSDGHSSCDGDCNDTEPVIYPGAVEACDGIDTDCDGNIPTDEVDGDGDAFFACNDCDDSNPLIYGVDKDQDGFSPCSGDCDESNSLIYPGTGDVPGDGVDQNCDLVDGNDSDGDGFSAEVAPVDCDDTDPDLLAVTLDGDCDGSLTGADCDDSDAQNFAGNTELCDGQDNNCNASIDEDFDGDGDGSFDGNTPGCLAYYGLLADCDDSDPLSFPGAPELVDDAIDQDCDGSADIACANSYTVDLWTTATNLAELTNCGSISGDLAIVGDAIPDLSFLSSLGRIYGDLLVASSNLTNFNGLSGLTIVDGAVEILQNDSMTGLAGLDNLTTIGGWLSIEENPALLTLEGLSSLEMVLGSDPTYGTGLHIADNQHLSNIHGLSSLEIVGGSLALLGNDALASIDGLANLSLVGDDLILPFHAGLTDLDGLASLSEVSGHLDLSNPALTDISGLSNLTSVGSLTLDQLFNLPSLAGLDSLHTIDGDLTINWIDATDLDELSSLSYIGGDLTISGNDWLNDISGLANLTSVLGSASVRHNPLLCASSVSSFLANTSITGSATQQGNDDGC
ncbi:MAG: hypothetical protein CMP23_10680 [Rickettsiales bacterium]|nr:hypothetical protein [Rickettsiales bacterium]|tara:strand:- start:2021 stop:4144 length:2124 start_codon:yes stop_codon:yes gene_type:complete